MPPWSEVPLFPRGLVRNRPVQPGPYIVTVCRFRLVPFVLALVIAGVSAAAAGSSSKLPGLMTDKGPWGPNDGATLKPRLKAIGLHALPREALKLHTHQRMAILVNGKPIFLPAGIGIDVHGKFIGELHTHDYSGIIHVESPVNRPFTLGEFFDVWGLRFSSHCLGGYCATTKKHVLVWADGKQVKTDPRKVRLTDHLSLVVAYGTPDSVPKPIPKHFPFPKGY
jgi:hypothetical protein